jgi:type I restriction enzyme S subunit
VNIRIAPIGDFVEPVRTWNPTATPDLTFNYVDLSAVDQIEKQIKSAVSVRGSEAPSRARQLISSGDILVSTVRPNLNGVAAVTDAFDGATASTGFCVLRPRSEKLSSNYLMHWVRSPQFIEHMVREATGASYPAVSDRIIKASHMPLPPLDEQRRIAAILDKADGLRRKRKRALELLDNLIQSIFLDMFGDPASNPKGWDVVELAWICKKITDGTHDTPRRVVKGVPFITGKNIRPGTLDLSVLEYVDDVTHAEIFRWCNPEVGDILYVNIGAGVGNAAINNVDYQFSMKNVALLKLDTKTVTSEYVAALLNHDRFKESILGQNSKGGAQKFLSLTMIKGIKIPLPFNTEITRFSERVRSVQEVIEQMTPSMMKLDTAFSSLQSRIFSGQLS